MILLACGLTLLAAVLHAAWNVLLKTTADPLHTAAWAMGAAVAIASPPALLAWLLSGRPGLPAQAWALAVLSSCVELAYFIFLSRAYRSGDLSLVYPLARGTAPLLSVPAGLILLSERLTPQELAGVALLLIGIWAVRRPVASGPAVVPALLTGVCIASYTLIDRVGVRIAIPWVYGWALWTISALILLGWVGLRAWRSSPRRAHGARVSAGGGAADAGNASIPAASSWPRIVLVGLLIMLAYSLVLVALSVVPLTIVAPLRESAVVLVTGWGIWRLKERRGAWLKMGGAAGIVAGIGLLAL